VRKAKYAFDETEVRPYLELTRVLEDGVFYSATRLYGITFKERHDLPVYHADVRVFEVFNEDGSHLALFYFDPFERDNKRGGAWMSSFVRQSKLLQREPVIYNVSNIPKAAAGEPQLIRFSDVITLFHEFGHTLHGMFSEVTYPSFSGTSVPRDFVEFPSQFNEHWAMHPEIFSRYARHHETGEGMPDALREKMKRAERFNQGYELSELLAAAELDLEWHTLADGVDPADTGEFEKAALTRKGLALRVVPPRYRSTYFAHVFGGGYASGYYAYLWSEMLEYAADEWFARNGGLSRANGDRLRRMVLAKGNTEDPQGMFEAWLGGKPGIEPMLRSRGLVADSVAV
jgi:peptidyl-dipeptidase Dcp